MRVTTARRDARWRPRSAGLTVAIAAAATAGALALGVPAVHAGATAECIEEHVRDGESRAEAVASCLRENAEGTTVTTARANTADPGSSEDPTTATARPGGGFDPERRDDQGSDDGDSAVVLIGVGVGGVLLGAALATLLRRGRPASSAAGPGPSAATSPRAAAPPLAAPPAPLAPAAPAPPPAPTAPDRSGPLVSALIDLGDRVPSAALRSDIVTALASAGVRAVEPTSGEPFDPARMRGVGTIAAPDAASVGRVAATERAGFVDRGTLVRLPEVIVYASGS